MSSSPPNLKKIMDILGGSIDYERLAETTLILANIICNANPGAKPEELIYAIYHDKEEQK